MPGFFCFENLPACHYSVTSLTYFSIILNFLVKSRQGKEGLSIISVLPLSYIDRRYAGPFLFGLNLPYFLENALAWHIFRSIIIDEANDKRFETTYFLLQLSGKQTQCCIINTFRIGMGRVNFLPLGSGFFILFGSGHGFLDFSSG